MQLKKHCLLLLSLLTGAISLYAEPTEGTVNVHRLNVRVKPGNYTVVGSLKRGDKVNIMEEQNGWFRISLPSDAPVWVAAQFVSNGKIIKNVNMRSGPSIKYRPYGEAKAGQSVTVLSSGDKNKGWVKIAPLPTMSAWVSTKFITISKRSGTVENTPGPASKENKMNTPASAKTETKTTKAAVEDEETAESSDTAAEEVDDSKLPFIEEPAEEVNLSGVILALKPGTQVVTHALCSVTDGNYRPVCYLYGNKIALSKAVEKKVEIKGSKRWVKGWKVPVVKVTNIEIK